MIRVTVAGVDVGTRHWVGDRRVASAGLGSPFGGAGLSGIGREGGTWSFDFYSDVKNTVCAQQGWHGHG